MRKTLIIAEAGVNHNGSIDLAKQLIDAADNAGVDYVKFQTFNTHNLVSEQAKKAEYQTRNFSNNKDDSQYSMLKKWCIVSILLNIKGFQGKFLATNRECLL
jgi:sialic acid synthase SpsE